MGEVKFTKQQIVSELREANHRSGLAEITMYADAFLEYQAAQGNIAEHGSIVFHPRTGAPIENPYIAIRDRVRAVLMKSKLRADPLWEAIER